MLQGLISKERKFPSSLHPTYFAGSVDRTLLAVAVAGAAGAAGANLHRSQLYSWPCSLSNYQWLTLAHQRRRPANYEIYYPSRQTKSLVPFSSR